MARLVWGTPGERFYETGVDRGVLFVDGNTGVPWNGLTSVNENTDGGDAASYYLDGYKYQSVATLEEFEATIEAYSAPKEFMQCDGVAAVSNGLFVTQQPRKPFSFSYRTLIGNDEDGPDHGYKIHLVYNALAAPSTRNNETIGNSADPLSLSWDITTLPPMIAGYRPTAHFVITSTATDPILLGQVEDILYGNDDQDSALILANDLLSLFMNYVPKMGYGFGYYGHGLYGHGPTFD